MQIHQVVASEVLRHEVDPIRGIQVRKEQVLQQGSAATVQDPEFGTFHRAKDGSFDVPDELAESLLAQPGWFPGPNPFAEVEPKAPRAKAKA